MAREHACTSLLGIGCLFLFGLHVIGSCVFSPTSQLIWRLFFSFKIIVVKIVLSHLCFLQIVRAFGLVSIKNIDNVLSD